MMFDSYAKASSHGDATVFAHAHATEDKRDGRSCFASALRDIESTTHNILIRYFLIQILHGEYSR